MAGRIEANLRQIMLHEAKPCPKAMASTTVTRGFEAVAYPKIVSAGLLRRACAGQCAARHVEARAAARPSFTRAGLQPSAVPPAMGQALLLS